MIPILARLRDRKLAQWAIAYLAGAWVLLQVLQLLSATYEWPPTLMRAMPVALAIGLVVVLVLAWYHGEQGQQRAGRTEIAILSVVLLAGTALLWGVVRTGADESARSISKPVPESALRLAVLPFESVGAEGDASVADGISDEIRGKLSGVAGLEVIGRVSSTAYRGTTTTQQDIASELDVEYLLVGTVRSQPAAKGQVARIRVSPELLQISKSKAAPVTRWQEPFDAELTDVFQVQSDIAQRVALGLDIALGVADRASIAKRPTSNPEAYEVYLQALNAAGESFREAAPYEEAVKLARRAVQLDPGFGRAWSDMAAWAGLAQWFTDRRNPAGEYFQLSEGAANQALRLSPELEGPIASGNFLLFAKGDFKAAAEAFSIGLRRTPKNDRLLLGLCTAEQFLSRWAAAAEHCQAAASIDPRNASALRRAAVSLAVAGNSAAAVALGDRSREIALASGQGGAITEARVADIRLQVYAGNVEGVRVLLRRALEDEVAGGDLLIQAFNQAYWLYEPEQLRRVLAHVKDGRPIPLTAAELTVSANYLLGDTAAARKAAPAVSAALRQRLSGLHAGSPTEGGARTSLAITLALSGRIREAIQEGERATQAMPLDADGINAPVYHRALAWIYLLAGDTTRALDVLTPILEKPHVVTRAAIRTDTRFAALRGNPRFDRLVAQR